MGMVITRYDKFGCIGDVCGATSSLQASHIPRNCINAVREGARDAQRNGVAAWARNDRFLYLGLVASVAAVLIAVVQRFTRSRLPALPPPSLPPPRMAPPSFMDEFVLVPKHRAMLAHG